MPLRCRLRHLPSRATTGRAPAQSLATPRLDSLVINPEARMFRRFALALDFVLRLHGGARRLRHTAAIAVFVAAFVGLNQSSVRAESSAIATVHLTPGWATFGEAVPRGVAFDALQVGSFQTQTDVKTRWDDHSIRFAIVTVNATADGDYAVVAAATAAGVPLT